MTTHRTITRESGLRITQESDTELSWEYLSASLSEPPISLGSAISLRKTIEGRLIHTNARGGGWSIECDTPGVVHSATTLMGELLPLQDAIREVEKMIQRTEAESVKPDPRERRKRELEDLFDPDPIITLPSQAP